MGKAMASKGVNKVILLGNLGKEPEVANLQNGVLVANFSIATSEIWKDKLSGLPQEKTEWHRVVCFRRLAEIASEYLKKGSKVYIEGRLQTRKWQDKTGVDHYSTEIIANELYMVDNKSDAVNPVANRVTNKPTIGKQVSESGVSNTKADDPFSDIGSGIYYKEDPDDPPF